MGKHLNGRCNYSVNGCDRPSLEVNSALDAAVLRAYGWPEDLSDEAILERLLALNLARAGKGSASNR